jgi:hypothetical protein
VALVVVLAASATGAQLWAAAQLSRDAQPRPGGD